ncbi:MAG: DUF6440 family protein [Pseudomonadota bacterium]
MPRRRSIRYRGRGTKVIRWAVSVLVLLGILWISGTFEYDSTDNGKERSGLKIFVDHKTGVQYLGTARGGLTPRVDRDGRILTVMNDE